MALRTFRLRWNHGFETHVEAAAVRQQPPVFVFTDENDQETHRYTDPNIESCDDVTDAE